MGCAVRQRVYHPFIIVKHASEFIVSKRLSPSTGGLNCATLSICILAVASCAGSCSELTTTLEVFKDRQKYPQWPFPSSSNVQRLGYVLPEPRLLESHRLPAPNMITIQTIITRVIAQVISNNRTCAKCKGSKRVVR